MTASTRRAALGAILITPLANVPAVAAEPSDLARACNWAIGQAAYIDTAARSEDWDDNRLDIEMGKYDAVFTRALTQPSESVSELVAKARLCLRDFEANQFPFHKAEFNDEPDDLAKMVMLVLREVITLCA